MTTNQLKKYSKATPKESNKLMVQNFECRFCGNKFHRESTLSTHMCVKKRRHMEIDSPASRSGFRTFQKFYDITMGSKKPKSTQEFIESDFYIDFVKFGNHVVNLKPVYPDKFIEFVIRNGVNLRDWTKDFVYDTYIEDLIKKEPAEAATERTIITMAEWATEHKTNFTDFFKNVSANEAARLIRTGKISPWVLYLSESGGSLIDAFNDDHAKIVGSIIDPGYWMKKFKNNDDVSYIKDILAQSGI